MADIFLSYSRDDQATARRFAEALEREGFSVWWDQALKSGDAYDRITEEALRGASAVVVLWSRASVDSRWVRAEAVTAERRGTLRPVMIEACERPVMFELTHTAELLDWRGDANDPAWRAFVACLRGSPVESGTIPPVIAPERRRWWQPAAVGIASILVIAAGAWIWRQASGARQARTEWIPEIARLVDAGEAAKAFELAQRAREFSAGDPLLKSLTPLFSTRYAVHSSPSGAEVFVRAYDGAAEEWRRVGVTPLEAVDMPRTALRWRFEKAGFDTVERATSALALDRGDGAFLHDTTSELSVSLTAKSKGFANTVLVPAGRSVDITGPALTPQTQAFRIDRHEVTNAEFKAFVDAGGYERSSLWEGLDVRANGTPLTLEQVRRTFVDATGRPGPATWELGSFVEGRGDYPVTGVSWYEAAAYARFRGGSLPTYDQWLRVAWAENEIPHSMAASIAPRSNFGTGGLAPVEKYQGVGLWGTYDVYGNAREWIANPGPSGGWLLGGSWDDPAYQYSIAVAAKARIGRSVRGLPPPAVVPSW